MLRGVLRSLRRATGTVAPRTASSKWSDYEKGCPSYSETQVQAKDNFVSRAIGEVPAGWVLDVGANTGRYSEMAASAGHSVVAIDTDPAVVGLLFQRAQSRNLPILPLTVSLSHPTPPTGWRNRETLSFLDRARGRFDCVLCLGVLHHMIVTDRIPIEEILALLASLTRCHAIIEFIAPQDPLFHKIARGRDALHAGLTLGRFELALASRFKTIRSTHLPGMDRSIYFLELK